jgi:hypothetical protein
LHRCSVRRFGFDNPSEPEGDLSFRFAGRMERHFHVNIAPRGAAFLGRLLL